MTTLKSVEKEKKSLEHHIQQLESSLAESKANANIMANMDSSGIHSVMCEHKQFKYSVK